MLNEPGALGVLSALAQETRLRIVRILVAALPEGLSAGRVAEEVGCTPSTLTFHLRNLQQAGLVRSRRQSTSIIYSAAPDVLNDLSDFLMRECCGGRPELCRPATADAVSLSVPETPAPARCGARTTDGR